MNAFSSAAQRLRAIHQGKNTRPFIANVDAEVVLLEAGSLKLPATVNDGARGNAWVCSPLTTYYDYALEEVKRSLHPLLAWPIVLACRFLGGGLRRAGIDRSVAINNWMLSTNLYPDADAAALDRIIATARSRWPDHALWFRSLNNDQQADWIALLRRSGFAMLPSRQVYLFDVPEPDWERRHQGSRRDQRLLRTTSLTSAAGADFDAADFDRAAQLYRQLYIEKYSALNPQYTAQFLHRWHEAGLFELHGFRDQNGQLQAVVGLFRQGDTITAPIVGYNCALPVQLGLYRLLMARVLEQAALQGARVNLSAGAAQFKRLRGGRPALEFSAVLVTHLPWRHRCAIGLLQLLTTVIGVPIMRIFQL